MSGTLGVIGGWDIALEAAVRQGAVAAYDTSKYDTAEAVYDDPAGSPDWVAVEAYAVSFDCSRGASPSQSAGVVAEAGSFSAELYDPARVFDPTCTEYRGLLEPGAPVRVVARKGAAERLVWSGTAEKWEHDTLTAEGRLSARDVVARIAGVPLEGVARPVETTPQRLAGLLANMSDAPPLTISGTGKTLCAATMSGDLWRLLAAVVDSDASWLWVDASGGLRWAGRGLPVVPPVVLLDAPDAAYPSAAIYTGLPVGVDVQTMVNEVTAGRVMPEGVDANVLRFTEAPSRYRYDPHSYDNTALQVATDNEVTMWATDLLKLRAYPNPRPFSVTVHVHQDLPWADTTMDALLSLDLAAPVLIRLTTRGDQPQEWQAVVAGVSHQSTPETWATTLTLALAEQASYGGYDSISTRYDQTQYEAA